MASPSLLLMQDVVTRARRAGCTEVRFSERNDTRFPDPRFIPGSGPQYFISYECSIQWPEPPGSAGGGLWEARRASLEELLEDADRFIYNMTP